LANYGGIRGEKKKKKKGGGARSKVTGRDSKTHIRIKKVARTWRPKTGYKGRAATRWGKKEQSIGFWPEKKKDPAPEKAFPSSIKRGEKKRLTKGGGRGRNDVAVWERKGEGAQRGRRKKASYGGRGAGEKRAGLARFSVE